ncbi:ACP S-malonyltransferase [Paenibacillus sp. FSL R5-0519]|uniref:ACP S-malonyltransferase n=1 Tax=Paenibacillus sp. FSL R5-0519 TaxID=2921648 RepID=UPI0030DAE13B
MEKIAFLFPGQGSQYVGMMKNFYDQYEIARQTYEEANHILGFDLAKMSFEGSLFDLNKPSNMQPALLTASVVAYRVYMEEIGINPQFCAGHSLGEYAALTCSGAMTFGDAVRITKRRGELTEFIADEADGAMTIIDGADEEMIRRACEQVSTDTAWSAISCYNASSQYAISGHQDSIEQVESILLDQDAQTTPLMMSAPFHSRLMEPAGEQLGVELAGYRFHPFKWPVVSNVTATPYTEAGRITGLLQRHLSQPVKWAQTMQYLKKHGVTLTIELGPKNVLSGLVELDKLGMKSFAYGQKEDRKALKELLDQAVVSRPRPTVVTKCMAAAVATPNRNWDQEQYQKGVVEPYKQIQQLQEELEAADQAPTTEQMKLSLEWLGTIFETKQVEQEERDDWFHQILDETGQYYLWSDHKVPTA